MVAEVTQFKSQLSPFFLSCFGRTAKTAHNSNAFGGKIDNVEPLFYTVNILTVKSTDFKCVAFPSVVLLHFWQSRTVKYAKLVFKTSQNCFKRALKVQGKKGRR